MSHYPSISPSHLHIQVSLCANKILPLRFVWKSRVAKGWILSQGSLIHTTLQVIASKCRKLVCQMQRGLAVHLLIIKLEIQDYLASYFHKQNAVEHECLCAQEYIQLQGMEYSYSPPHGLHSEGLPSSYNFWAWLACSRFRSP